MMAQSLLRCQQPTLWSRASSSIHQDQQRFASTVTSRSFHTTSLKSMQPRNGRCIGHKTLHKTALLAAAPQASPALSNGTATGTAKGPVVVVDNYDSFTYNLCQYLGDLGCDFVVFKNDEKTIDEIRAMNPRGILVSPGPGRPEDSGISLDIIGTLGPEFPVFGVCMGHQCIGQIFGGDVVRAPCGVMHGKPSPVYHTNVGLLEGLPNPFQAARYHSLVIKKETIPDDLEITAWTEDGTIMAVRHKKYPHIQGVQFHPESIITDNGIRIVSNFVNMLSNGS